MVVSLPRLGVQVGPEVPDKKIQGVYHGGESRVGGGGIYSYLWGEEKGWGGWGELEGLEAWHEEKTSERVQKQLKVEPETEHKARLPA